MMKKLKCIQSVIHIQFLILVTSQMSYVYKKTKPISKEVEILEVQYYFSYRIKTGINS